MGGCRVDGALIHHALPREAWRGRSPISIPCGQSFTGGIRASRCRRLSACPVAADEFDQLADTVQTIALVDRTLDRADTLSGED
jgi:hypothetical protein